MKILIITSIEKEGVGGPSLYADNLPVALAHFGTVAKVLRGRNFLIFLWFAPRYDILYSLSGSPKVNVPLALCAKIFRKKFCLRPGGDFLWERATERGGTEKTPREYYRSGEYEKQGFPLAIFRWTLASADKIIFPTLYLKRLYQEYFSVEDEKCARVDYPFPDVPKNNDVKRAKKSFVFAGRLVKFKNCERLIRAFAKITNRKDASLFVIGEGPQKNNLIGLISELVAQDFIFFENAMSHDLLLNTIRGSYCVIVPSIFEPGSFFMLESLKLGVPVIFTKESGLYEAYASKLLFVDPYSVEDIKSKIEFLLDEENYARYLAKIRGIDTSRSWRDVAKEHVKIFAKL